MQNLKKLTGVGIIAAGLISLMGCFPGQNEQAGNGGSTTIGVRVGIPQEVVMAKTSVISLNKLILVLTSNVGDTIRDTITSGTIPALCSSVASNQTVGKYYSLRALRKWMLHATTKDANNIVIHDSSTALSPTLLVGDTAYL